MARKVRRDTRVIIITIRMTKASTINIIIPVITKNTVARRKDTMMNTRNTENITRVRKDTRVGSLEKKRVTRKVTRRKGIITSFTRTNIIKNISFTMIIIRVAIIRSMVTFMDTMRRRKESIRKVVISMLGITRIIMVRRVIMIRVTWTRNIKVIMGNTDTMNIIAIMILMERRVTSILGRNTDTAKDTKVKRCNALSWKTVLDTFVPRISLFRF